MIRFFILLLICLTSISCEEQFFFDEDKEDVRQVVISGYINQGPGPYYVRVQQTSFTGAVPTDIYNAKVILFDEGGNQEVMEEIIQFGDRPEENMVYHTGGGTVIKGFPGRAYFIEVTLPDGRCYLTEPDRMPSIKSEDQISWEEISLTTTTALGIDVSTPAVRLDLLTSFKDQNKPIYLTWLGEEAFVFLPTDFPEFSNLTPPPCYITRPIGAEELTLFTNVGYNQSTSSFPGLITRLIDKSFQSKHIFTVYQYSLSERNYNYMRSIEVLAENTGSLFDKPPGVARGNVVSMQDDQEKVQGYFQAVIMDTTRIAIFPNQIQSRIPADNCEYQEQTNPEDYPLICRDCLELPNSTQQRPGYWITTN